MNKIWTAIIGDNIRVFLANTTEMTKYAVDIHKTSPISSVALSRTLTATSILGKTLKNDKDLLTLKVAGIAQIKTILATSDTKGYVKGYISNSDAELATQNNTNKIGKAVGLGGNITVIRDYGLKEPYIGMSHLISGEIDEDIAFYFKNSEQQPTWMKLDCSLEDTKILGAGGVFVQTMPDVSNEEKVLFKDAEDLMANFFSKLYAGEKPEKVLEGIFPTLAVRITGEFEVDFACDCSKERIARALITLGPTDLGEILEEDGHADIQCHFCNTNYHFNDLDLKELIDITNA